MIQAALVKGDKEFAIKIIKALGGSNSQVVRELEDSSLEECRKFFEVLHDNMHPEMLKRIDIKNKQIFIMHFVALSFLILGSAAFFISKINKQG